MAPLSRRSSANIGLQLLKEKIKKTPRGIPGKSFTSCKREHKQSAHAGPLKILLKQVAGYMVSYSRVHRIRSYTVSGRWLRCCLVQPLPQNVHDFLSLIWSGVILQWVFFSELRSLFSVPQPILHDLWVYNELSHMVISHFPNDNIHVWTRKRTFKSVWNITVKLSNLC